MTSLANLFCLELTKLGTAYQIINQFVDNENLRVFEVSPTPSGSILILSLTQNFNFDEMAQTILTQYKDSILECENIHIADPQIIQTYLSQNTPQCEQEIGFFECESVVDAFRIAQKVAALKIQILDFRVLRSAINKTHVIVTGFNLDERFNAESQLKSHHPTIIKKPTVITKSFFEIQK